MSLTILYFSFCIKMFIFSSYWILIKIVRMESQVAIALGFRFSILGSSLGGFCFLEKRL